MLKELSPSTGVFLCMSITTWLLATLHVLVAFFDPFPSANLVHMFDMGAEQNVPTWFSSLYWLSVGLSAFCCFSAENGMKFRWPWLLIGAVFSFASLDEFAEIHEAVGTALKECISTGVVRQLSDGSPHSPWIGFYLPILVAVVLSIVLFLLKKMPLLRWRLFVLSGFACYALAILQDFYQGMETTPAHTTLTDTSILFEEVLEMFGCIFLTSVFIDYAMRTWRRADNS
ncbi:MAG: hypothetical protein K2W95_02855 [Candidatus Obscuribacterales bacterium]|nr:hypothetical protein [Candidatus Obscuribacterales bacterium]